MLAVTVTNGWLILEGEVEAESERRELEAMVRRVNGLSGVSNRLVLSNTALAQRAHQTIIETFIAEASSQAFRVEVAAYDRTTVLTGAARMALERDQAVAAARKVPGAEAVVDRISLPDRSEFAMDGAATGGFM